MKTKRILKGLALITALTSFGACQNVERNAGNSKVENAPFEAIFKTQNKTTRIISHDQEGNPIQMLFTAAGSGEMTQMGKVKVFVEGGRNVTNGTEIVKTIFVDSKGDSLFIGGRTSVGTNGAFTSQEQINGGTGRYVNATGNSTSKGETGSDGSASWTQSGTISF